MYGLDYYIVQIFVNVMWILFSFVAVEVFTYAYNKRRINLAMDGLAMFGLDYVQSCLVLQKNGYWLE